MIQVTATFAIWCIVTKLCLGLVLLALCQLIYRDHIFFSACALSIVLLCIGWCNFWKFIFYKVV